MITQRPSMHHVADRKIALMPIATEGPASRLVGRWCIALIAVTIIYFAGQYLR